MAAGELLASAADLADTVRGLATAIGADFPDGVVLVGVLNGSVIFLADLARAIDVPVQVDFCSLAPFTAGGPRARLLKDLDLDLAGRDVVLVEDVLDTGLTATWLFGELERRGASSVSLCALVDRDGRRLVPVPVAYRGYRVGDRFVVGYGIDHHGRYRNLPDLWLADPAD